MLKQSYQEQTYNYIFKVVLIGSMGVGKTSMINRYCDDTFINKYQSTIGVDFRVKLIEYKDNQIKMQIWDTSGYDQMESMNTDYQYKGSHGILAVFDLCCRQSFQSISMKIDQIINNQLMNTNHILLVGTKSDMVQSRQVESTLAIQLGQKYNLQYIETNATDQSLIDQVFQRLLDIMIQDGHRIQNSDNLEGISLMSQDRVSSIFINQKPKTKKGCC